VADRYRRFTLSDQLEHIVQLTSFTVLGVTGLVQRYSEARLSRALIDLFGGIENTRNIHRVVATILMLAIVYHVGAIGYRKYVQRRPPEMLPNMADLRAGRQAFKYLAGRADQPPRQGRFLWEEKVEYWSLVWGTLVMVVTGFLLWNPIATANMLPGEFIPVAKAAHSGEALLAVLAVLVWHFYHVHLKHFNTSMFTGYMSREDMAHEHALELESIESGSQFVPPTGPEVRRRARIYLMGFTGISLIMLAGIYMFVSFEETALATIAPPEQVQVFAPVEASGTTVAPPTTAGPGATTSTTAVPQATAGYWDDTIQFVFRAQNCTDCHGKAMALGDLDLTSYAGAVSVVTPGDPDGSRIIELMETGAHPAVLDDGQLVLVRGWIAAGAPESAGDASDGAATAAGWPEPVSDLFESCLSCHGESLQMADLDLSSYEAASASIVPGDPDASTLYLVQSAEGHAGQFDDAQLAILRDWIAAGAPQG